MTKQHRPENGSAEQKGNPSMEILQPPNWPRPNGFSNGIAARGRLIFIAGQIGWDEHCRIQSSDFSEQVRQALKNIIAVLAASDTSAAYVNRQSLNPTKACPRESSSAT